MCEDNDLKPIEELNNLIGRRITYNFGEGEIVSMVSNVFFSKEGIFLSVLLEDRLIPYCQFKLI